MCAKMMEWCPTCGHVNMRTALRELLQGSQMDGMRNDVVRHVCASQNSRAENGSLGKTNEGSDEGTTANLYNLTVWESVTPE